MVTMVSHLSSRAIGRTGRWNASLVPARSLSHDSGSYSCQTRPGYLASSARLSDCSVGDDEASLRIRAFGPNVFRSAGSVERKASSDAPRPLVIGFCERSGS